MDPIPHDANSRPREDRGPTEEKVELGKRGAGSSSAGATGLPTPPREACARVFADEEERRRYVIALRQLSMREVSVGRLARRAGLMHRLTEVRNALRSDARYEKVRTPGPERYVLRSEYRHAHQLQTDQGEVIA